MTKKEFAIFAQGLRTYYPRENILPNSQAIELWYAQLEDIPARVAEAALHKWVAVNKWSPSIADIRETVTEIIQGATPDWGEAWRQTMKAIRYYGIYDEEKAIASLDDVTATTVQRIGWQTLCMSENIDVERANFRMIYETEAARKKREKQIPPKVAQLTAGFQLKSIEDGIREG